MILGITGSIGCGKSTVLKLFHDAAWRTADADGICRKLYDDPAGAFADACRAEWGDAFFTGGAFDRAKIAQVVFNAPAELEKLTKLIYPHLGRELDNFIAAAREAGENAAVEVPLLYEKGMSDRFDAVLTVWAPREVRHARLREFRNFDEAEILRREKLQMDADEKLERADYAFVNSGDAPLLEKQFSRLLREFDKR